MYSLNFPKFKIPKIKFPKIKLPKIKFPKFWRHRGFWLIISAIVFSSVFGFFAGGLAGGFLYLEARDYLSNFKIELPEPGEKEEYIPQTTHEEKIISAVKKASPAVVSIIVTKDLPVFEEYYYNPFGDDSFFDIRIPQRRQIGTEETEIGGGSGFIVSEDGIVLTNKHVVLDEEAQYTIFTNDGKKFDAKVLARDPIQDIAILKIETEKLIDSSGNLNQISFPVAELGDSSNLQIGQTAIAIGNALGEFKNTVSVGVVSGLDRTIVASGSGITEIIEEVIQTDTAINQGNSGGPLLNLNGKVIGINTATVIDAQSIGFAIPIDKAKRDINQVKVSGKIEYAYLGIRYLTLTKEIMEENSLPVSEGAWITSGDDQPAIIAGSAAEKAGLREGDIITEIAGEKLTEENILGDIIYNHFPGDSVEIKILREGGKLSLWAVLDKWEE
jgi:serine protease Do